MFLVITKQGLRHFLLLAFALMAACLVGRLPSKSLPVSAEAEGILCIVIDDFGYGGEGTAEMLALDCPITAAVMPFSSQSGADGAAAAAAGKEVILHMPMESLTGKPEWVGEKGIFTSMTDEEIASRVREAVEIVPNAVGINNHMGSKIMEDARALRAVMTEAKAQGLLFLDSRTTPNSKAGTLAAELALPLLERSVFLDSTDDGELVKNRLRKAGELALSTGYALAIGHVGPEGGMVTVNAIKEVAPQLEAKGVRLVTISEYAVLTGAGQ